MFALIDSPNAKTPDAIYSIFYHVKQKVPGARYGGGYTLKPGFHASVNDNLARWPSNYSIRDAINRREPHGVGRAVDITLSTSDMKRLTEYLRAAVEKNDARLQPLREFFGTLNGSTVYGRAHDGPATAWRSTSADSSHLWHIHLSIFTPYANDWEALAGIVSVLIGESWEAWMARKWGGSAPSLPVSGIPTQTLRENDSGPAVLALQVYLNGVINAGLVEDGRYGPATTTAVRELQRLADITIDGVYGDESEAALKRLLEDDMPLTDTDVRRIWAYRNETITRRDAYAQLLNADGVLALQSTLAAQTALIKQLAAAQSGLTAEQISAAVANGVRQAIPSPESLAAAVAAAVDHDLDVAAAAEALRQVLGSLDGAGA